MTHYLITVGTSQLKGDRKTLSDGYKSDDLKRISEGQINVETSSNVLISAIRPALSSENEKRQKGVIDPKNNRWGAEITTLWAVRVNKQEDYFHLLCSDSTAGDLAGKILYDFLENVWGVSSDRLSKKSVPGLQTHPGNSDEAREGLDNLAVAVATLLKDVETEKQSWRFVISGGFKSTIPVLTWFALAHNIPLDYIFEESEHPLKGLTPKLPLEARNALIQELNRLFPKAQLPPKKMG